MQKTNQALGAGGISQIINTDVFLVGPHHRY